MAQASETTPDWLSTHDHDTLNTVDRSGAVALKLPLTPPAMTHTGGVKSVTTLRYVVVVVCTPMSTPFQHRHVPTYVLLSSSGLEHVMSMAAVDQANLPPEEAEAARKAVQRQLQREREWLARQKLKAYVALPEFDSRATTDFYGFGKVLGQGSFGEVRLAWHRLAGQKVAIKSYEKSKLTEPNHWRRVQQEIRLMERLNHPHIIRELEMIDSPKRIHIAMEYAGGGNLCSYVKAKQRLSEGEARKVFLQLLAAVEYMHDNCIIHRDIKLENVLFDDEQQNVKLTDFGFSVMVRDPMKRLKIFCGTPSYMAPEITQRREYLGRPVDVWSLAVLLYACLAGHFPFTAKTCEGPRLLRLAQTRARENAHARASGSCSRK